MFVYVNVFARPHLSISLDVGNAVKSPHDEDCVNTSESESESYLRYTSPQTIGAALWVTGAALQLIGTVPRS